MGKKIIAFLRILSVFLGTVVGAGIFGLPFVAEKSGFFIIAGYFLLVTSIAITTHLILGSVVLYTKEKYRLPGYVGKYMGDSWKKVSFFLTGAGLLGALLVYIIIGGEFLNSLLNQYIGGSPFIYSLFFFALGSYFIFRGIKNISNAELLLLIVLLLILLSFFLKLFPFVNLKNIQPINFHYAAFPFGIILFSLWGTAIIPEIKEMITGSFKKTRIRSGLNSVIIIGLIISAFIYLSFVFIILSSCGSLTSPEAISGIKSILGAKSIITKLAFIFGVICCFTSFLALGLTLKKIFWYDFGLPKNASWLLTCLLPLVFFLAGAREFIKVINLTGAIAIGGEGIIIVLLYQKFLKNRFGRKPRKAVYLLIPIFIIGAIAEIISLIII
ncbi:MAG TPA: hypothetical protein ENL27_02170 [Candidatus Parcubacteria bacterium]|nr:hypothetical protein [Candidatus Parcubacteria bacterium]